MLSQDVGLQYSVLCRFTTNYILNLHEDIPDIATRHLRDFHLSSRKINGHTKLGKKGFFFLLLITHYVVRL
jgi:hypothetical protein